MKAKNIILGILFVFVVLMVSNTSAEEAISLNVGKTSRGGAREDYDKYSAVD